MYNNNKVISFLRQFSPARILAFGLGLTFLYAGVMAFADPVSWVGYVPEWVGSFIPIETFTVAHGVFQVLLGGALLCGVLPRTAASLATAELAAILVFYGIDAVTFRDLGLFFASLSLLLLSSKSKTPQEGVMR